MNWTDTNDEDMTWYEWACAAGVARFDGYGFMNHLKYYPRRITKMWRQGVDPTEVRYDCESQLKG